MLRKFISFSPRGYQLLGTNVRSCQAVTQASNQACDGSKESKSKLLSLSIYASDTPKLPYDSVELKYAEKLLISLVQNTRVSRNAHIEKFVEYLRKNHERTYRTTAGQKLYLWCSGVLAITSALLCQKWFIKDDFITKAPQWFDAKTIQQALQGYFWGIPRDRLLLPVKATGDSNNETKKKLPIDVAAQEFKSKTEECTASILNKVGLQLINSNQAKQAAQLFERAALAGNTSALYNMGLCFEHGKGVAQSLQKAAEYYKAAASKGHGKAQFNLATFYAEGTGGLQRDYNKAVQLLEKSADNGVAKAQVYMGFHYAKQNDQTKSANFFSLASDQKDPVGTYHFAICLENGWGVRKDISKAGQLYEAAAENGHVSAMFNIATFYEKGLGDCTNSRQKAIHWYERAADCGDEEARIKLKELLSKPQEGRHFLHPMLRDILVRRLFPSNPTENNRFHRSRSAPNLGTHSGKLNLQSSMPDIKDSFEMSGELSASVSCGLEMSAGSVNSGGISFGLA